jgi:hypothetical protein
MSQITDDDTTALDLPIATEPQEIRDEIDAALQDRMPQWAALPTHPITHLRGALSEVLAESRAAIRDRLRSELLDLLGTLFRFPRSDGEPASSTLTVTARDSLGHAAPGPVAVTIGDVVLEVPSGIEIPAGQTSTVVAVVAVEYGADANGAAGRPELAALSWLAETDGVTLNGPLDGGADRWTDDEYAVRLVEELQTMSASLILARDYSIAARRHPGVAFAWTLPHYLAAANPADDDPQAPLHVTTIAVNSLGGAISSGTRIELEAEIKSRLPDNVVHHLVDPTPHPIPVTATVARRPGFAKADVQAVLNPANYASPKYGDDANPVPGTVIHKNELVARLDELESSGLNYVVLLQIGDGSSDRVTLGVRELPSAGEIKVTVVDG